MAQDFGRMPLGTGRGMGFVASVATGEATGDAAKGRGDEVSFFCHFEEEAVALVRSWTSSMKKLLHGSSPSLKSERTNKTERDTKGKKWDFVCERKE